MFCFAKGLLGRYVCWAAVCALLVFGVSAGSFAADGTWETLEGCKLLSAPDDDGDSFFVEHQGKEYHFRLYFVDAPETDKRFRDRLREQAAYWEISEANLLEIARQASKFSADKLKDGFTIYTKREEH
jgi:hypothetical protein